MELVALLGLLTVIQLVVVIGMGVLLYRHHTQIEHLAAVCTTLTKAWEEASGQRIQVDPALLGLSPDVIADTEDTVTQAPPSWKPWGTA